MRVRSERRRRRNSHICRHASRVRTPHHSYLGGCNGARIRFSPEKDWPINAALDRALNALSVVQNQFEKGLSWADLIVLAGQVSLERSGAPKMKFCGGRTDASDGAGSKYLSPKVTGSESDALHLEEYGKIMGMSKRELVALVGGGHSLGSMHPNVSGYDGSWTTDPTTLDNSYFSNLLDNTWSKTKSSAGKTQYKADGKDLYMLPTDVIFKYDAELQAIAQEFASDNEVFLAEFVAAWTKIVNADRFDGPGRNLCDE